MKNLLRAEFYKVKKSKTVKICLLIAAAFALLMAIMTAVLSNFMPEEVAGMPILMDLTAYSSLNAVLTDSLEFSVFVLIAAIALIVYEFSRNTIRNYFNSGYTRGQIYFAKFLTLSLVTVVYFMVYLIITFVTRIIFFGTGGAAIDIFQFLLRLLFSLLFVVSLASIITCFSVFMRSAVGLLIFVLVYMFIGEIFTAFINFFAEALQSSGFSLFADIISRFFLVANIGFSKMGASVSDTIINLFPVLVLGGVAYIAGWQRFERLDLA